MQLAREILRVFPLLRRLVAIKLSLLRLLPQTRLLGEHRLGQELELPALADLLLERLDVRHELTRGPVADGRVDALAHHLREGQLELLNLRAKVLNLLVAEQGFGLALVALLVASAVVGTLGRGGSLRGGHARLRPLQLVGEVVRAPPFALQLVRQLLNRLRVTRSRLLRLREVKLRAGELLEHGLLHSLELTFRAVQSPLEPSLGVLSLVRRGVRGGGGVGPNLLSLGRRFFRLKRRLAGAPLELGDGRLEVLDARVAIADRRCRLRELVAQVTLALGGRLLRLLRGILGGLLGGASLDGGG